VGSAERALRSWPAGFTSKAQTYADLFAQPGRQSSEFRGALWRDWFAFDDWSLRDGSGEVTSKASTTTATCRTSPNSETSYA
jgi:hypothetical protein